jgi:hypothetical protein
MMFGYVSQLLSVEINYDVCISVHLLFLTVTAVYVLVHCIIVTCFISSCLVTGFFGSKKFRCMNVCIRVCIYLYINAESAST